MILPKPNASHAALLNEIAAILGVPVETFCRSPAADETVELLRLWAEIADGQGRRRVLNLARQEARRCGYSDDA